MAVYPVEPASHPTDALSLLASLWRRWTGRGGQRGERTLTGSAELAARSWLRHRIVRSWNYGQAELGSARTYGRPFERGSWIQ
jgi:hypothetical protein